MARQMREEAFRIEQEQGRYAPHVRPVNEMVDALRDQDGRGWMPHVAPWHGGVEARVLSILRDPGPKTQEGAGSGSHREMSLPGMPTPGTSTARRRWPRSRPASRS